MTLTDYICQEKKEEEDMSVFKTVLTHRYNLKTKYKIMGEDLFQSTGTIQTIWGQTEQ